MNCQWWYIMLLSSAGALLGIGAHALAAHIGRRLADAVSPAPETRCPLCGGRVVDDPLARDVHARFCPENFDSQCGSRGR